MKNLIKAAIKVMKEVKGLEKNSRVGSGGMAYDGTKDKDVKEAFNKLLSENGLWMYPTDIEEDTQVERWVEETNYGPKQKQSVFTKVKVHYMLCHDSGEHTQICGYGHGVDPQDKSAGKATTYAMKNALLYTFCVPVGKIDDTDRSHSATAVVPPRVIKEAELITLTVGDENMAKVVQWVTANKATPFNQLIDTLAAKYTRKSLKSAPIMKEFKAAIK